MLCSLLERGEAPDEILSEALADRDNFRALTLRLQKGLRGFISEAVLDDSRTVFPPPVVFIDQAKLSSERNVQRDFLPQDIVWYATHHCPRTCRYCHYVKKGRSDLESEILDFSALLEIARNCRFAGVERFVMTGGEPMLRRDAPQILSAFADEGVDTLLFTRYAFTEARAAKLVAANVTEVYYSLDDVASPINELIVENSRVAVDAKRSLSRLTAAGLAVTVVPVLTRLNARSLPMLARSLDEWGVKRIRPIAYKANKGSRYNNIFLLSAADKAAIVDDLAAIEAFLEVDYSTLDLNPKLCVCESGINTLYMQPNGDIAYCPFSANRREMFVGRLPADEISAIWRSQRLSEIMNRNSLVAVDSRKLHWEAKRSACVLRDQRLDVI